MKNIHTIGLDVSKNVFQVRAVDKTGEVVAKRKLSRVQLVGYLSALKPCLVGMEATSGTNHLARRIVAMGHTVKLMPASYVKPYVKTNKNDANDAEAICEAVRRPNMRFVPIKSEEQQALLTLHRARALLIRQRVALTNAMRGFLSEFGNVVPQHKLGTAEALRLIAGESPYPLPELARITLKLLVKQYRSTVARIEDCMKQIKKIHKKDRGSRRLATIPGIGPLTATALVAIVGDARAFRSGRQLSAWLGLVPRQNSSGGRTSLGHISKRGDTYLRSLLYLAAMSTMRVGPESKHYIARWAAGLSRHKSFRVAVVALANKLARIAWAVLAHDVDYREPTTPLSRSPQTA